MTVDHLLVRGLPLNVSFLRLRHVKSTHSEGTHTFAIPGSTHSEGTHTFAIPDPHIPKAPIPRSNRIHTYRRNLKPFPYFSEKSRNCRSTAGHDGAERDGPVCVCSGPTPPHNHHNYWRNTTTKSPSYHPACGGSFCAIQLLEVHSNLWRHFCATKVL